MWRNWRMGKIWNSAEEHVPMSNLSLHVTTRHGDPLSWWMARKSWQEQQKSYTYVRRETKHQHYRLSCGCLEDLMRLETRSRRFRPWRWPPTTWCRTWSCRESDRYCPWGRGLWRTGRWWHHPLAGSPRRPFHVMLLLLEIASHKQKLRFWRPLSRAAFSYRSQININCLKALEQLMYCRKL